MDDFDDEERKALSSLAEMFSDKDSRDTLRRLVADGTTLKELVFAYRANRRVVGTLKAIAGLIVLFGGAFAALKGLSVLPK